MDHLSVDDREVEGAPTDETTEELNPEENATQCIVTGVHAFILRISSYVGLAPLKFESRGSGSYTVKISKSMCAYNYIFAAFLVIFTISGLSVELSGGLIGSDKTAPQLLHIVAMCDIFLTVALVAIAVCTSPRRMQDMLKFMEIVTSVDTRLNTQFTKHNERKIYGMTLAIVTFGIGLAVDDLLMHILSAQSIYRAWQILLDRSGFFIISVVNLILELQFALTSLYVCARFQAVNEALCFIVRNINLPVHRGIRGPRRLVLPCDSIQDLLNISLCDVVHIIGNSYAMLLIGILMSNLLRLIVKPYFVITDISVSSDKVHMLVLYSLYCVMYLIRLFIIVEPCHQTAEQKKKTEELICELMTSLPPTTLFTPRLELFSRQLMLQSVAYSPMGMCTLNRSLMISILGAVVTYLIILIQLQN